MFGKKLLQKGLVWRVGDGKQISLCNDNWIPDTINVGISASSLTEGNQTVSTLLSSDGKSWDEEAVKKMFGDEKSRKILEIPLSMEGCTDFASWPFTKNDIYTVRSGYNLARTSSFWQERSNPGRGSSSNTEAQGKTWRKLWKTQCPERMKIILWRMAHNCLPTGDQLQKRAIQSYKQGMNVLFAINMKQWNIVFYIVIMSRKFGLN